MARYALVIGIAKYDNFNNLPKAVNDAQKIAQLLSQHGRFDVQPLPGKLIESENCWQVAPDKKLTGKELGQALRVFLLEKAKGAEALIYFAGHGFEATSLTGEPKGYLATSDCSKDGQNAIAFDDLNTLISKSKLSSLVVLLDCCYAGSLLERSFISSSFPVFNSNQDYCFITASRAFERAREDAEGGIFTQAVITGLANSEADETTGEINVNDLMSVVTRKLKGSGQEAIYMGGGRSIPVVWYPPRNPVVVGLVSEDCPYRGLEAFDKQHTKFFFGRQKVVNYIQQKLAQANFVTIIGASGSGKSSVVRAGLIPVLEKNGWQVLSVMTPGVQPLATLRAGLERFFPGHRNIKQLDHFIHNPEIPDGLNQVIQSLPQSERFLLIVDQFEEVFTLCYQEDERSQFIKLITQVAEIPNSQLIIIITMRADFLEPCLSYESLTNLIQNQTVYIPPLVGADLEQIITFPANLQGYKLETGLLGEILQDIGQEKECLPLLEFALTELWQKRDQERYELKVEHYSTMGGVLGALDRHAENIYKGFTEQEQEWIKLIFLSLVRTGEGSKDTRQRQIKRKLLQIAEYNKDPHLNQTENLEEDRQTINYVLDELIQGRLLVAGKDIEQEEAWVDLAHEAIMEGWQRFAQWRQENRELRRQSDRIEDAWWELQKKQSQLPSQLIDSNTTNTSEITPVVALKELVARLHREQMKIQDLLSSLGFALRSFNNLNQFLELIPLMATRVTDADGGALFLYKPNGQIRLEQLHCQDSRQRKNIRRALETASSQVTLANNVPLATATGILDAQIHNHLGSDVQIFGTAILVKHTERGWLYILSRDPEYTWTETRQKLVRLVADQTAVAIENEELRRKERLNQELEIGGEIQRRLLPRQCPAIPGAILAARCKLANHVGRGYYDFIPTNRTGSLGLVIGDVMGKGVPAALFMTMIRGLLRGEVLNNNSPAGILQNLNRAMYADLENAHRLVKLFYSEYNPQNRILSYSNAAHKPPLWWHAANNSITRIDTVGMLIGLDANSQYEDAQAQLEPGDAVIYYTDGLIDATSASGDRFDEKKLITFFNRACESHNTPEEILDYIFDQIHQFMGLDRQNINDMSLIVMKINEKEDIN